jgi:hypothetical protein
VAVYGFFAETWMVAGFGELEGAILLVDGERRLLFHV